MKYSWISGTYTDQISVPSVLQRKQSTLFYLMFIGPCIVIYFYSKTNQMHQCIKFILFCNNTLHVSDGLSVQLHEFQTVHTATDISVWHMPVAVCTVWNSWWWTERPSETCKVLLQNKINLIDTLVHLVGFTIEILYFNSVFTCYNFDSVFKEGSIVNPTGGT